MKKNQILVGGSIVLVLLVTAVWWRGSVKSEPVVISVAEKDVVVELQYRYTTYTPETFAGVAGKRKRVYFFVSDTCTSCNETQQDYLLHPEHIPDDAVIFRTDMNQQATLATQYQVQAPHTFVQVTESGDMVATWTDGDSTSLTTHLK